MEAMMKFMVKPDEASPAELLSDSDAVPGYPIFGLHKCKDCDGLHQISFSLPGTGPGTQGVVFRLVMSPDEFEQIVAHVRDFPTLEAMKDKMVHEGPGTVQ